MSFLKTKGFLLFKDEGVGIYLVMYSSGSFKNKNKFIYYNEDSRKRTNVYHKTNKGKIAKARNEAKRKRNLGYNPMNKPFDNSNGHHLNETDILFIPTSIHRSVSHSVLQDRNMKEINDAGFEWLCTQESL